MAAATAAGIRSRHLRTRTRALLTGLLAVLIYALSAAVATADTGPFSAGKLWTGEFADPSVMRVGNTFYAYATNTGGDNLPVLRSTDLVHWYARPAYPSNANPGWWSGYNDALPHPAKWALYNQLRSGHWFTSVWAPGVAYVGNHYVDAYSVPNDPNHTKRRCISIATSSSPIGQFFDTTTAPIVCSSDTNGSNDPQIFAPSGGPAYLLWKNTGVVGSVPTRLWTRQLDTTGTAFATGSTAVKLLSTAYSWEGNVIENPAMIKYAGRYYLFYSANGYATSNYAIGYAICTSAVGPCTRPSSAPFMRTGGAVAGPGAPSPFVGLNGELRMGYAAWDIGHVGYGTSGNARRLHVATLAVNADGTLRITNRG